jgi:hypothetical protein
MKSNVKAKTDRVPFTMEECNDIFRQIFHTEVDALAATIQLFRGDPISWADD